MSNIINNSNPDEMLKISKKIAQYADNLKKDMKFTDILSEYENITDDNLWKTFVYSDDPEGDRTYNLFLYDDYKLDFYEETTQLNYIDEETHQNFLKRSILNENDILIKNREKIIDEKNRC